MRIPSLLLALAAVVLSVGAAAQSRHPARTTHPPADTSAKPDQGVWEGTYTFQEGGGRAGGFVEHTIVISRQGDALIADIDANGFQTSRSLRCGTKIEGDKLNLYFQRYREGKIRGIVMTDIRKLSRSLLHQAILLQEMELLFVTLYLVQEPLEVTLEGKAVRLLVALMNQVEEEKHRESVADRA